MNFDLDTIIKAIQLVGPLTDAGKLLYSEFMTLLHGSDQDKLKAAYFQAMETSDQQHGELQGELKG